MLIAVIQVDDYSKANSQILAAGAQADGIELRLDYLSPPLAHRPATCPPPLSSSRDLSAPSLSSPCDLSAPSLIVPRLVRGIQTNAAKFLDPADKPRDDERRGRQAAGRREELPLENIAKLRSTCRIPVIFTLRKNTQGGYYQKSETERLRDIYTLAQLSPDWLDIESCVPDDFASRLKSDFAKIKLIRSYHNFSHTPADLPKLLDSMQHPAFDAYKIATFANTSVDALRMLTFVAANHPLHQLTGLCMGKNGQITRILSQIAGNAMHYAAMDELCTTAPGQLSLKDLLTFYKG